MNTILDAIIYLNSATAAETMQRLHDPAVVKVVSHGFHRVGRRFHKMLVQRPDEYTLRRHFQEDEAKFRAYIDIERHGLLWGGDFLYF